MEIYQGESIAIKLSLQDANISDYIVGLLLTDSTLESNELYITASELIFNNGSYYYVIQGRHTKNLLGKVTLEISLRDNTGNIIIGQTTFFNVKSAKIMRYVVAD